MALSRKGISIFAHPADRGTYLAYLLGAVVPLVALGVVGAAVGAAALGARKRPRSRDEGQPRHALESQRERELGVRAGRPRAQARLRERLELCAERQRCVELGSRHGHRPRDADPGARVVRDGAAAPRVN